MLAFVVTTSPLATSSPLPPAAPVAEQRPKKFKRGTPTGQSVKKQADQCRQNSTTLFRRTRSQRKPLPTFAARRTKSQTKPPPTSPPAGQSVKEQVDQFRQNGTTLFRRTRSQRKPLPTSTPAATINARPLCLTAGRGRGMTKGGEVCKADRRKVDACRGGYPIEFAAVELWLSGLGYHRCSHSSS